MPPPITVEPVLSGTVLRRKIRINSGNLLNIQTGTSASSLPKTVIPEGRQRIL